MMRWSQMSETHDERGPLGWSVVAGAEHAADQPAICHHSGPDAAAPAIPQDGHAVSQIGMRTGKNAVMGGHTRGAGAGMDYSAQGTEWGRQPIVKPLEAR